MTRSVEALERRAFDLAKALGMDRQTATELLAGAIATVLAGMTLPPVAAYGSA